MGRSKPVRARERAVMIRACSGASADLWGANLPRIDRIDGLSIGHGWRVVTVNRAPRQSALDKARSDLDFYEVSGPSSEFVT